LDQLAINFNSYPVRAPDRPVAEGPSAARFAAFHAENPQVYSELLRLAREARALGAQRIGIKMLWEVMRWNLTVRIQRADGEFKLNNNYHSRYARMLQREPDLAGCFELRELKTT
jgi:hypothetical protein